jgi:hypothetical protein
MGYGSRAVLPSLSVSHLPSQQRHGGRCFVESTSIRYPRCVGASRAKPAGDQLSDGLRIARDMVIAGEQRHRGGSGDRGEVRVAAGGGQRETVAQRVPDQCVSPSPGIPCLPSRPRKGGRGLTRSRLHRRSAQPGCVEGKRSTDSSPQPEPGPHPGPRRGARSSIGPVARLRCRAGHQQDRSSAGSNRPGRRCETTAWRTVSPTAVVAGVCEVSSEWRSAAIARRLALPVSGEARPAPRTPKGDLSGA